MHYMFSLLMLFLFVSAIMGCSHINISDPSPDQKYFAVQLLEMDSREIITGENALKSAEREGKLSFEIKKNKIEKQCYSISKKASAFYRFRPALAHHRDHRQSGAQISIRTQRHGMHPP